MRPERLVVVCGTGTDVGKTWVCSRLLGELRGRGQTVAVRKPAQSFDVDSEGSSLGGPTDAEVLAAASGEDPGDVCHSFRSYHRAMAPPMAAEALGLPTFSVSDLDAETQWPADRTAVGVVELAGGVRSPQACDGDATDMLAAFRPDVVVLVADAGLGCINGVRLSMDALGAVVSMDALGAVVAGRPPVPTVVVLDRFDGHHDLHRRNRRWLSEHDRYPVVAVPGEEAHLADLVTGAAPLP